MMVASEPGRARFLFRAENGTIDAATWRFHAGWLVLLTAALTAIWLVLRPYTHHDLATSTLIVPMTIVAFTYLILFSFAVLFIAISYTMLTMKRLRAIGRPTGLAGLVPLLALLAGSTYFLREQTPDVILVWHVAVVDILLGIAIIGTIAMLGISRDGR